MKNDPNRKALDRIRDESLKGFDALLISKEKNTPINLDREMAIDRKAAIVLKAVMGEIHQEQIEIQRHGLSLRTKEITSK